MIKESFEVCGIAKTDKLKKVHSDDILKSVMKTAKLNLTKNSDEDVQNPFEEL